MKEGFNYFKGRFTTKAEIYFFLLPSGIYPSRFVLVWDVVL